MGRRNTKKSWYIVSYDIRNEKRLKRFHYHLKKQAIALQKSVFLVEHDNYQAVLDVVKQYSKQNEDDIRLYPIVHPNALWGAGLQADAIAGLGVTVDGSHESTTLADNFIQRTMKWFTH